MTRVSAALNAESFAVSVLHGRQRQDVFNAGLANFRTGASRILVSTSESIKIIGSQRPALIVFLRGAKSAAEYCDVVGGLTHHRCSRRAVVISLLAGREEDGDGELGVLKRVEREFNVAVDDLPMDFGQFL